MVSDGFSISGEARRNLWNFGGTCHIQSRDYTCTIRDWVLKVYSKLEDNTILCKVEYEFNASPETVVEIVLNLRRNVPYFYDTLRVIKFNLVSVLILCPKQPWWSAAFAHIIVWCKTTPQPSTQVSSSHHGRCHLRLVWAQSIWGASGTCHYHYDACV